jgi:hypothetical protein
MKKVRRVASCLLAASLALAVLGITEAKAKTYGGGTILAPATRATVPYGRIAVKVRVRSDLVGHMAAIKTVPGWSLGFYRNRASDYSIFRIPASTFTIRAPQPPATGKYTIRINREIGYDNGAIAQVRVLYRRFSITHLAASPNRFYPLVRDGFRDRTKLLWDRSLRANTESMTVAHHGTIRWTKANGSWDSGWWHFNWNGVINGHRLRPGTYRLRMSATYLGVTTRSPWMKVVIATGWRTVQRSIVRHGTNTSSRSTGGSCYISGYNGVLTLDCWGGRYASATYRFAVPNNAFNIRRSSRVRLSNADFCCHGKISKVWTGNKFSVVVTGWRAADVYSARVTYNVRMRI